MARPRGTGPGDLVLIHFQGRPATFARVEGLRPQGRPGWFFCDLLVLTVPPQPMTWILEREQVDGTGFTMGGQPVRIERAPDVGVVHEQVREAERAKGSSESTDSSPAEGGEGGARPGDREAGAGGATTGPARDESRRPGNVVQLFPRR
ncbi:hypothetical protein KGQ64_09070 [bacterium]|nr:hypothetical protein [bacterium]